MLKAIEQILNEYTDTIRKAMPASVAKLIEVEIRNNGAGVLAPFWLPVLERGRAPRKNSTDHKLYTKIYDWMAKRNMFKSKTEKGRINEAKSLTWFINKYGTKMYRDGVFKDVYSRETEKAIEKIDKAIQLEAYKITREIF